MTVSNGNYSNHHLFNNFYFEETIDQAQNLSDSNSRIKFERLLMGGCPANENGFQWCTKAIMFLCEKIELDKTESLGDKETEDILIEKIICKFGSEGNRKKTVGEIQNTAQKVFTAGRLNSWEIFQAINNSCSPSLLTSTKTSLIKSLRENGEIDRQDPNGNTVLLMAVEKGDAQIVKELIENQANIEVKNLNGDTALMLAVKAGNNQIIKMLIEAGANIQTENNDNLTLLMIAAISGNLSLVNDLISLGIDLNKNSGGKTALMYAAFYGHSDVVEVLVNANVDESRKVSVDDCDEKGMTALMWAIDKGNTKCAKILIENKTDLEKKDNKFHFSALFWAISKRNHEIVRMLIKAGAKVNVLDINNMTPLQGAIMRRDLNIVRELIEADANLNALYSNGMTPLMLAAQCGYPEIVEALIHANVDDTKKIMINQCDIYGSTALMRAALKEDLESFKILINAGADINIISNTGESVLTCIKLLEVKKRKKFIKIMKNFEYDELKKLNKEHRLIKSVGHALDIKGTSTLTKDNSKSFSIPFEGGYATVWFRLMQKDLVKFKQNYPDLLTPGKNQLFEKMLEFAANQKSSNNFERIQQGAPTIVHAGFKGHTINLFVWGNQIAFCNRGAGHTEVPIEFFHYTQGSLTNELLKKISEKKTVEQFMNLIYVELPTALNLYRDNMDKQLREAARKDLPMQAVGNCTWANSIAAIYCFMQIGAARSERDGKLNEKSLTNEELAASIEEQTSLYQKWLSSQQVTIMERLSQRLNLENLDFRYDFNLFEVAFNKANSLKLDPLNKKRLDDIFQIYNSLQNTYFSTGKDDVEFEQEDTPEVNPGPTEEMIAKPQDKMDTDKIEMNSTNEGSTKEVKKDIRVLKRKADKIESVPIDERPTKIAKSNTLKSVNPNEGDVMDEDLNK